MPPWASETRGRGSAFGGRLMHASRFRSGGSSRQTWRAVLLAMLLAVVVVGTAVLLPATTLADAPALATVAVETPLLATPNADAAELATLPAGTEVFLDGSAAPGFLAVCVDGRSGWIDARRLSVSNRVGIPLAAATLETPILAAPRQDAAVLGTVPPGGVVILTGANVGAYVAASYEGTGGWIAEADLGMPFDADHNAT